MGFEETLCGKVGVQFLPVFGGKLLLPGFPADGSVFLVNLLVGSVVGDMGKGGVDGLIRRSDFRMSVLAESISPLTLSR